jgi:hypothetical protein
MTSWVARLTQHPCLPPTDGSPVTTTAGTQDAAGSRARALDPLPGLSHTPDSPLRAYLLGIKPAGISNAEWFVWIGLDERKEKR